MKSVFHFYSKGIVAEDLKSKNNIKGYIKVYPEEHSVTTSTVLSDQETIVVDGEDTAGNKVSSKLDSTTSIPARWLNLNDSNRVTPPYVVKGEDIMIFRFGETELYYWTTMFTEIDLRKKETVLYMYGNQNVFGETSDVNNSYWQLIDTINKKIIFHTSDNDGEACTYDFTLDTLKGEYLLEDGIGNRFHLESVKKTLTIDLKILNLNIDTININGKTVNLKGDELNISESKVDLNAAAFTISGGKVTVGSKVDFGSNVDFGGAVKMNGNAKTSVGPHAHVHTIE